MKISLKWLAEYVELPASVDELAHRLTMAGLEVEGMSLKGVIVGQILSSEKHPNADKLSVTKIDDGSGTPLQVVCGAKNYKVGDKVPLATVDTELPNGMKIARAKVREIESCGMLCSSKELGLSEESSGLMILDPDARVGAPLAKILPMEHIWFEVNVTPNRSDALSHLGIARDLSAVLGKPLKKPVAKLAESATLAADKVKISIADAERCWRYAGRVIEGVKVQPSPAWVQERLKAAGVRAINNLVDVTNYVMLEYGQPLHAFDLDRIGGAQIIVRTAKAGEKLKTLDGKDRELHAEDLVIADEKNALVIAGVMGGESSEVTDKTTRVLLECATFQPATVRRSSKRHGLHTESSHRFERGTDVSIVPEVLDRAAALLAEWGGGTVLKGQIDVYPTVKQPRVVTLRPERPTHVLGAPVSAEESAKILTSLGFISKGNHAWEVPLARVDVSMEEDLVEEIARVRGFESIPAALPRGLSTLEPERPAQTAERRIRTALSGEGFDEVVNYSFVAPAELAAFQAEAGAVTVSNPLSVEQSVMRTTLFASLVPNVARSARHQAAGVRFYEWGRSYQALQSETPAHETLQVAGVLWGLRDGARTWTEKDVNVDFYDARAAVEAILASLHIEGAVFQPLESPWYHPRAAATVSVGGKVVGTLGELHPRAQKRLDAPTGVFMFQLEVGALLGLAKLVPQATAISKFPSVRRDLAVVVNAEVPSEQVRSVILEVGQPLVADARIFDVFQGAQVGAGRKNLAFALEYRSSEKTLTDAEVIDAHAKIVAEVTKRVGGALRA